MGIVNREGSLYLATGIDNTGLYAGRREAMGIIKAMAGQITSFDVFSGIGISAATAFASAAKSSYDFEKEFRKNMLEVATISTQVTDDMTGFMNQVMAITQEIPIKAPEAAKALYQIVSAGHDGADGMKILEVSAKSAVGGLTDTATAADAITTVLNAYKMSADEASNISDQLFTTVRLGKTTFGELGQSIAQVAPIAASYGVEIDQVLAAVASLTKQGTPTAQAMTQIRAAIIGTSKVLGDGAFESRTFQEALAEVATRASGSESKLRELVPEIEAVNGVLGMTGKNAQAAASDLGELQSAAGATEAAFDKMKDEVGNQMILLSNNIQAALRPMGEAILKNVSEAAQVINHGFETGNLQNSLENLKKLLIGVAGAYITYKSSTIGATSSEVLHSAKLAISNNLKSIQNKVTGESILAKEKERVYQEAYNASLEKTITEEQRAKLSKMNLKAGSDEYIKALTNQAMQEKKNADNLVVSLTKQVEINKLKLVSAQENLDISHKAVDAAKAEFDAAFEANDLAALEVAQTKMNAAAKREEAAAINVSTSAKKLKSTESKLLIASTTAENAATRINTATTVADTAVTNIATGAKNKLKVATVALWGVMKANPLGAVLTMISFATTAYMLFADKIKATETAQSRLNRLQKATADNMANEQAELRLLLSIAKNELVSKEEREKAIKRLNDISPEYLGNLSLENLRTQEATDSIDAYTKAIEKNAKMKAAQDMVADKYKAMNDIQIKMDKYLNKKKQIDDALKKGTFTGDETLARQEYAIPLFRLGKEKDDIQKEIDQILSFAQDQVEKKPVSIPVDIQLESEQSYLRTLFEKKAEIEARIKDKEDKGLFADALDVAKLAAVNKELTITNEKIISLNKTVSESEKKDSSSISKEIETVTGKIATLKQELADLRSGKTTVEAGKTVQSVIEEKEKELKAAEAALATLTGKTVKETDKGLKAQQELSRSILESELKLQADRIAIMQDGKDKRILLADQEYKETLSAIEKARAEYQKKVKEAGQREDPAVMATFDSRESAARSKRDTDVASINKEYFDDYAKRTKALTDVFVSEEKKRLSAVRERYDEERKWAQEQLKTGGMSEEQYQSYVINIDKAEAEESLRSLLDKYQDYATERKRIEEQFQAEIETLEKGRTQNNAASVDAAIAEARKKEREALSNLDLENLQKEIDWSTVFGDLEKVSTSTLKRLQEQLRNYLSDVGDTISKEDLKVVTDALTQIGEVQADRRPIDELQAAYESYTQACGKVAAAQQKVNELEAKGDKTSEEYKKAVKGLTAAQDERRSSLVSMTQAVNSMGQKGGELVQAGSDITGMLTDLGVKIPESIAGALDGLGQIASSLSSIDLTKPFSIITGITGMIGGIGKTIGSLFNKDHKKEKNIERLQAQVEELDKSYEKLSDSIEKAYSVDASALIDQQNEMLEKQKLLIQQQIAEEESKKHSDNDRIKEWKNQLEDIDKTLADNKEKAKDAIFGEDLKSAIDNFASAYAEAWASGEDRAESAKDTVKKMMRQMVTESIKAATESSGAMKKIRDKLKEFYADNVLSGWEQDYIYNMAEELQKELDRQFGWAESLMKDKVEEPEKEEVSENTLKGAYAKASQESITLLAGQTGAVRVLLEDIRSSMQPIREQMRLIYEMQVRGWEDVKVIRELSDKVEKNTGQIAETAKEIKEIAGKISENTSGAVDALEGTINVKVKM